MKKITLLAFALFMSVCGYSQYYQLDWDLGQNPGNINMDAEFPVGGGLPGGWTTVLTGPSTSWSGDINLPFTFNFNGTDYTTCKVAGGMVSFGTVGSYPGVTPAALPSSSIPDNTIAIWGLEIGTGDFLITKTFGSSPNRQFWVQMNTAKNATVQNGWAYWSIVLEEGTNNIYIVDQRNQCVTAQGQQCTGRTTVSAGIQIDENTAISIPGSPALLGRATNDATSADNVYYAFYPGVQATEDIMMNSTDMVPDYELSKGAINIKGDLRNVGSRALTSFDLHYVVNGGDTVTENVTGVNIASGAYHDFTHATPFIPTVSGPYSIDIWTSNPNGMEDGNKENDEVSIDIRVHDKVYVRKPLYEVFTSSTCGPCTPGNTNFHNVINGKEDECVYIKYQQSWPSTGDPYCTAESNERRNYYSINSVPRMELDGEWDQNANSFTAGLHTDYTSRPAFMDIKAELVRWGKHVEVDVEIDPASDFAGANILHVAIIEKETFNNEKTNGETEFLQVMKKMITNATGDDLGALTKDTKVNKSYTWDFKGEYTLPPNGQSANWINHNTTHSVEDFENLMVAVWVQNRATKEVHQATYAVQTNLGVVDMAGESKFSVYPNPALDNANVTFDLRAASNVDVVVLNTSGQEVSNTNAGQLNPGQNTVGVDLTGLSTGVYYVQLRTDFGMFTKPLTVK
ncbi:MAG: T9SS type A sorting domain-containing protein [Bacteroidia bacterium]|nr:T9SS type A sorting domain-containing protein [Bacteroidia bacterium]